MTELQLPEGVGAHGPWTSAGELTILQEGDGPPVITQADPRIMASAEVLDELRRSDDPRFTFDGEVFRIEAANRTVRYRVTEQVPGMRAYFANLLPEEP
ncbi:hypothetical protein [Microbispora triticiradicis]|uniref:hypothetical protein n=1 Tax=Microbispora triticiradicis TaxID=2200763 RepID=UPI001AD7BFD1|nr:hypothetical protein [Microbispora triticiradicis]MBO4275713.1 hypothetical protein [Microbispora triticiradicis]